MTKRDLNFGKQPNDKTGEDLRTTFTKINQNFDELYSALGDGSELIVSTVALTGQYTDIDDRPASIDYGDPDFGGNGTFLPGNKGIKGPPGPKGPDGPPGPFGFGELDDAAIELDSTWSSEKIKFEIDELNAVLDAIANDWDNYDPGGGTGTGGTLPAFFEDFSYVGAYQDRPADISYQDIATWKTFDDFRGLLVFPNSVGELTTDSVTLLGMTPFVQAVSSPSTGQDDVPISVGNDTWRVRFFLDGTLNLSYDDPYNGLFRNLSFNFETIQDPTRKISLTVSLEFFFSQDFGNSQTITVSGDIGDSNISENLFVLPITPNAYHDIDLVIDYTNNNVILYIDDVRQTPISFMGSITEPDLQWNRITLNVDAGSRIDMVCGYTFGETLIDNPIATDGSSVLLETFTKPRSNINDPNDDPTGDVSTYGVQLAYSTPFSPDYGSEGTEIRAVQYYGDGWVTGDGGDVDEWLWIENNLGNPVIDNLRIFHTNLFFRPQPFPHVKYLSLDMQGDSFGLTLNITGDGDSGNVSASIDLRIDQYTYNNIASIDNGPLNLDGPFPTGVDISLFFEILESEVYGSASQTTPVWRLRLGNEIIDEQTLTGEIIPDLDVRVIKIQANPMDLGFIYANNKAMDLNQNYLTKRLTRYVGGAGAGPKPVLFEGFSQAEFTFLNNVNVEVGLPDVQMRGDFGGFNGFPGGVDGFGTYRAYRRDDLLTFDSSNSITIDDGSGGAYIDNFKEMEISVGFNHMVLFGSTDPIFEMTLSGSVFYTYLSVTFDSVNNEFVVFSDIYDASGNFIGSSSTSVGVTSSGLEPQPFTIRIERTDTEVRLIVKGPGILGGESELANITDDWSGVYDINYLYFRNTLVDVYGLYIQNVNEDLDLGSINIGP